MPHLERQLAQKVIAVEAADFHNDNFRAQSWQDSSRQPWQPRKDQDTSRSLLVKSGLLRRSATAGRVRGSRVDFVMPRYGRVHNQGLKAGRGGGFKMPRRQFAGQSTALKKRFQRKAQTIINQRLRRF
jgi:phage gpG-like protein